MSDFLTGQEAGLTGSMEDRAATRDVLHEIAMERSVQRGRWGNVHDDNHEPEFWGAILGAYFGRVPQHLLNLRSTPTDEAGLRMVEFTPQLLRTDLIKLAAIAVAWVETMDRKGNK